MVILHIKMYMKVNARFISRDRLHIDNSKAMILCVQAIYTRKTNQKEQQGNIANVKIY